MEQIKNYFTKGKAKETWYNDFEQTAEDFTPRFLKPTRHYLQGEGFDTLNQLTLLGSAVVGAALPVAFIRYTMVKPIDSNPINEGIAWGLSTLMSLPVMPFTAFAGLIIGKGCNKKEKSIKSEDLEEKASIDDRERLLEN